MRPYIIVFVFLVLSVKTLPAQPLSGMQVAAQLADRLRDSLQLNSVQRDSLYAINVRLWQSNLQLREAYSPTDSLPLKLRQLEQTRDQQYQVVLGEEKYALYKSRKRQFMAGN